MSLLFFLCRFSFDPSSTSSPSTAHPHAAACLAVSAGWAERERWRRGWRHRLAAPIESSRRVEILSDHSHSHAAATPHYTDGRSKRSQANEGGWRPGWGGSAGFQESGTSLPLAPEPCLPHVFRWLQPSGVRFILKGFNLFLKASRFKLVLRLLSDLLKPHRYAPDNTSY